MYACFSYQLFNFVCLLRVCRLMFNTSVFSWRLGSPSWPQKVGGISSNYPHNDQGLPSLEPMKRAAPKVQHFENDQNDGQGWMGPGSMGWIKRNSENHDDADTDLWFKRNSQIVAKRTRWSSYGSDYGDYDWGDLKRGGGSIVGSPIKRDKRTRWSNFEDRGYGWGKEHQLSGRSNNARKWWFGP